MSVWWESLQVGTALSKTVGQQQHRLSSAELRVSTGTRDWRERKEENKKGEMGSTHEIPTHEFYCWESHKLLWLLLPFGESFCKLMVSKLFSTWKTGWNWLCWLDVQSSPSQRSIGLSSWEIEALYISNGDQKSLECWFIFNQIDSYCHFVSQRWRLHVYNIHLKEGDYRWGRPSIPLGSFKAISL